VGLTGAPGSGKSTLLDVLVREIRAGGISVGVIAVDPSSRRTGGALLGDRVRVRASAGDRGVFFRSLAAREQLGGLAVGARAAVVVLASVFDVVLVETVGVGQSESEVAELVDTLVYVAQPGAGDLLQFMKAGLLELPDVFAVNKADIGPAAERTAAELEAGIALGERAPGGWEPPVVLLSARDGTATDALLAALEAHRAHLLAGGALAARRRRGRDTFVQGALLARYGSFGVEALGGGGAVGQRLREAPQAPGFALVETLGREIEEALRKGASAGEA
jgi:LAO/AO transport system kinase